MADRWTLVTPTGNVDLNATFAARAYQPGGVDAGAARRRDDRRANQRSGDGLRTPGPLILVGRVWRDDMNVPAIVDELNDIRDAVAACTSVVRTTSAGTYTYDGLGGGPTPEVTPDGLGGWRVVIELWPQRAAATFTPPISPSVRVFDTFTGANGTLITAHAPDIAPVGSAWAQGRGTGVLELQGNMLANPSGSSGECIIDSGVSDCEITAKLTLGPAGPAAITFRAQQNGGVWDVWRADIDHTFGSGRIQIYEFTAGVFTVRASQQGLAISRGVTYAATVTLSGPDIAFSVAGVGSINFSSSLRQTATRHGLLLDVGATADDFKVVTP